MTAYAIGFLKVHDPSWRAEYGARLPAVVARHGGQILAGGGPQEVLEGRPPASDAVVVLAFPDMERARDWYRDPDNAELVTLRQTGSTLDLLLIQGKETPR